VNMAFARTRITPHASRGPSTLASALIVAAMLAVVAALAVFVVGVWRASFAI